MSAQETEKESIPIPATEMDAYTGHYYSEELEVTYRIFIEDENLFLRVGHNPKILMTYL